MKRKFFGSVLILSGLVSLAGADPGPGPTEPIDSINFDAKQPNPNPGGAKLTVGATGTYTLATGNTLIGVSLSAEQGGFIDAGAATTKNGAWSVTLPVTTGKGNYECWGTLDLQNGARIWSVKTPAPNPTVAVS